MSCLQRIVLQVCCKKWACLKLQEVFKQPPDSGPVKEGVVQSQSGNQLTGKNARSLVNPVP
jgi:hypothetical protein